MDSVERTGRNLCGTRANVYDGTLLPFQYSKKHSVDYSSSIFYIHCYEILEKLGINFMKENKIGVAHPNIVYQNSNVQVINGLIYISNVFYTDS